MIEALSIQDLSKPLNVSFVNKKSGQNYMYNAPQSTNSNSFELQIPSISFNKQTNVQNNKVEVILQKPVYNNTTATNDTYEFMLPNKDIICLMYVCFAVIMAIANLLIPVYQTQAAILLCPVFTVTILAHGFITQNIWNIYMGGVIILFYPVVLVYNTYVTIIIIFVLFTIFCVFKLLFSTSINWMHKALIVLLLMCSLTGIIIYQVYPKSIHGIHASFLSTCILACSVVIMSKKTSFKVTAVN
jgi:hypothetical protein